MSSFAPLRETACPRCLTPMQLSLPVSSAGVVCRNCFRRVYSRIEFDVNEIPDEVLEFVPYSVCQANSVFPLSFDRNILTFAADYLPDVEQIKTLRFILNQDFNWAICDHERVLAAIERAYGRVNCQLVDEFFVDDVDPDDCLDENREAIRRLLKLIISEAAQQDAEVVYIMNVFKRSVVLYQNRGSICSPFSLPVRIHRLLARRIRAAAGIDGVAGEGSFVAEIGDWRTIEWRATVLHGEQVDTVVLERTGETTESFVVSL